jgi:hypothetical protein
MLNDARLVAEGGLVGLLIDNGDAGASGRGSYALKRRLGRER